MEQDVDDFLAHYGVKGMRWGVRNERKAASGGAGKTKPKQKKKMSTSKKVAIATAATGAAYMAYMLGSSKQRRISKIAGVARAHDRQRLAAKRLSDISGSASKVSSGRTFMSSHPNLFAPIPMGPIGSTASTAANVARTASGAIAQPRIRG